MMAVAVAQKCSKAGDQPWKAPPEEVFARGVLVGYSKIRSFRPAP